MFSVFLIFYLLCIAFAQCVNYSFAGLFTVLNISLLFVHLLIVRSSTHSWCAIGGLVLDRARGRWVLVGCRCRIGQRCEAHTARRFGLLCFVAVAVDGQLERRHQRCGRTDVVQRYERLHYVRRFQRSIQCWAQRSVYQKSAEIAKGKASVKLDAPIRMRMPLKKKHGSSSGPALTFVVAVNFARRLSARATVCATPWCICEVRWAVSEWDPVYNLWLDWWLSCCLDRLWYEIR